MDFKAYQNSPVTQRAVERDFEIIGEALNRIKKIDEEFIERIPMLWRFVHAYNRIAWIDRTLVNIQHHFHVRNKAAVLLRWNYPPLVLPGFDFVFFKTRRTAS